LGLEVVNGMDTQAVFEAVAMKSTWWRVGNEQHPGRKSHLRAGTLAATNPLRRGIKELLKHSIYTDHEA